MNKSSSEAIEHIPSDKDNRFKWIFENAAVGIAQVSIEGKFIWVNQKFCDIFGYDRDEFLTRRYPDITHPMDRRKSILAVERALRGGENSFSMQKRYIRKDLSDVWGKLSVSIVRTPDNQPECFIVVVEDISEQKRMEEALRESEEKYRALVENSPDIIMRFDTEGRYLFANRQIGQATPFRIEEIIGKTFLELGFDKDKSLFMEMYIQSVIDSGKAIETEFEFECNSKKILFELRLIPEFSHDGHPSSVLGIARDVTEYRAVQKKYQMLFDQMLDGFALCEILSDPSGNPSDYRFLNVNAAFEQITGLNTQEILGKTVREILPGTGPFWMQTMNHVAVSGDPIRFDTYIETLNCHFQVLAFTPQKGQLAIIFQDISEMKHAEEKLQESKQSLKAILDSITAGIIVIDAKTHTIVNANPAAARMIGTSKSSLIGSICHRYICPAEEGECPITDLKQRVDHSERILLKANGEKLPILKTVNRLVQGNQELLIESFIDLSEIKRLESQLRQSQKMESIGTLAGGIAHDFNNILFPIIGYTEMTIEEVPKDSVARSNLEQILTAAKRAKDLIHQIMIFSKQTEHELKPVKIQTVIDDVIKLLRSTLPATIEIRRHIDPNCYPVMADFSQMHQVIMNLCTNAFHSMRETGGILEIGLNQMLIDADAANQHPNLLPGSYARLFVSDNGHGMNKEIMERIFDPYFSTKKPGEGTGMGLSIVHGIINSHRGYIEVASQPGEGTTFSVYLPQIHTQIKEPAIEKIKPLLTGNEHILLVDDEEPIIKMETFMLRQLGYRVTATYSGIEALELFREKSDQFDLVITDMTMPNMTGDRLAQHLKQIRPDIPIMLCTGFSEHTNTESLKSVGIETLILKPILREQLATSIRNTLKSSQKTKALLQLAPLTILVVEDSEENFEIISYYLKNTPYTLCLAQNGTQAIEKYIMGKYDVVLMDIEMPGINGLQAAQRIREWEKEHQVQPVYIIGLSAHDRAQIESKMLSAGMNACLTKPIVSEDLIAAISRYPQTMPQGEIHKPESEASDEKEFPGIDLHAVLKRFGGHRRILINVMKSFLNNYSHASDSLRDSIRHGDFQSARRLVHTIKGLAGNVCATRLFSRCQELEKSLAVNSDAFEPMDNFDAALKELLSSAKSLVSETDAYTPDDNDAKMSNPVPVLLKELSDLLENNNPRSSQCMESLKKQLNIPQTHAQFKELQTHIDHFDFKNAKKCLERFMDEYDV